MKAGNFSHFAAILIISIIFLLLFWPLGLCLLAIAVFFLMAGIRQKNQQKQLKSTLGKNGIPANGRAVQYFRGYIEDVRSPLFFWIDNDALNLFGISAVDPTAGTRISILKETILGFTTTGALTTSTVVSGGGVSLGGAVAGRVLLGPVGAVMGGRKKVSSKTITDDTRQTILRFTKDGVEKTLILGYSIYPDLCALCMDKKM